MAILRKNFCGGFSHFAFIILLLVFTTITYVLGSSPDEVRSRTSAAIVPLKAVTTADKRPAKAATNCRMWRTVRMRVTAYCPCRKCCGKYSDGITACGHRIQPGEVFVAADKNYPFGTEVIVPGDNKGRPIKVLDRGSAIKGNRLDVFFHYHKKACQWGVKYLDVKVSVK